MNFKLSVILLLTVLLAGCEGEAEKWSKIKNSGSLTEIENYLKDNPESKYKNEAVTLIQTLEWNKVLKNVNRSSLNGFKIKYPETKFAAEIEKFIHQLEFDSLTELKNLSSLKKWKKSISDSVFITKADSVINSWIRPTGAEIVEAYVAAEDYNENMLMAQNYDEQGPYYSIPVGMNVVVDVRSGNTLRSMRIKRGMTSFDIKELALQNDIFFDQNVGVLHGGITLVFSEYRLVGIR